MRLLVRYISRYSISVPVNRHPKGSPQGGRFAHGERADTLLSSEPMGLGHQVQSDIEISPSPSVAHPVQDLRSDYYGGDEQLMALSLMMEMQYMEMGDEELAKSASSLYDIARTTSNQVLLNRIAKNEDIGLEIAVTVCQNPNTSQATVQVVLQRTLDGFLKDPVNPHMIGQDNDADKLFWIVHDIPNHEQQTDKLLRELAEQIDARGELREELQWEVLEKEEEAREAKKLAEQLKSWRDFLGRDPTGEEFDDLTQNILETSEEKAKEQLGDEWADDLRQDFSVRLERVIKEARQQAGM